MTGAALSQQPQEAQQLQGRAHSDQQPQEQMSGGRPESRQVRPEQYSPLALAYLGDAVLELAVREFYVRRANKQAQKYHREVTAVVSAISQSAFMDSVEDGLSEEERDIYHRGRNASVHSKAKHATMAEYKKATGLEALIGYLYLKGEKERMNLLIRQLLEAHADSAPELH